MHPKLQLILLCSSLLCLSSCLPHDDNHQSSSAASGNVQEIGYARIYFSSAVLPAEQRLHMSRDRGIA